MKTFSALSLAFCLWPASLLASPAQEARLLSEWVELLQTRLSRQVPSAVLREVQPELIRLLPKLEQVTLSRESHGLFRLLVETSGFTSLLHPFRIPVEATERQAAGLLRLALDQPLPAPNIFEGLEAQGQLTRLELQRIALEEALARSPAPSFFVRDASEKLQHIPPLSGVQRGVFERTRALLNPSAVHDDALAYILRTFRDPRWDDNLLWSTVLAIRQTGRLNRRQAELLTEMARGSAFPKISHSRVANDVLTELGAQITTGFPHRFPATGPRSTIEWLKHEPIRSVQRRQRSSYNGSYLIEFENGRRAIFKPYSLEIHYQARELPPWEIMYAHEVGAYEFVEAWLKNSEARARGLSRVFVPPTVEALIVHDGRSYGLGALQEFQEGFVPLSEIRRNQPELWTRLMNHPQVEESLSRIRTLDWLIGNFDRLPNSVSPEGNWGNLMVRMIDNSPENAQFAMIDNGVGQGCYGSFWLNDLPAISRIPEDLQQVIRSLNLEDFARWNAERTSDIAIQDFRERLTLLKSRIK
jgi:hypothetical protein